MIEYLVNVVVEDYGPIGVLALLLWRRQNAIVQAVMRLAEEQPDVDENRVEEEVTVLSD